MLDGEALDAVAILSPAETHLAHLRRAAVRGLPTLCEKPFVWGVPDLHAATVEIVEAFARRKTLLYENCLWPLHPARLRAAPPRLARRAAARVPDGAAAGLARRPDDRRLPAPRPVPAPGAGARARARDRRILPGPAAPALRRRRDNRPISLRIFRSRLRRGGAPPRRRRVPAARGDRPGRPRGAGGWWEPETYRLSLAAPHRSVPLDDPLTTLVADFVGRLRAPDEADREARGRDIEERMRLLAELARAFVHEETQ